MATKRMFDRSIIETDNFLDLPTSCKALYFLLGMEADDEGFVSPKRVMRLYGGSDDDIRILSAKKLVIPFQSGVVVITDWRKNNWLDSRRIKKTIYQEEASLLDIVDDSYVLLSDGLANAKLEEKSIEEKSIEENNSFSFFWSIYPNKTNKKKTEELWKSKKLDLKINEILTFVERAKQTDRWKKGFVKAPDVFIRNESWQDDLTAYGQAKKIDVYQNKSKIDYAEKLKDKIIKSK
jgi:hypothetical protein